MVNRRRIISLSLWAIASGALNRTSAQTPEPLPFPSPGRFLTPEAKSVTDSFYVGPGELFDPETLTLLWRTFVFASDEAAKETFDTLLAQAEEWRSVDKYHELRWSNEVSIGKVAEDRFGFLSEDGTELQGVCLKGELVVQFCLNAVDAVQSYSSFLEALIADLPSLNLTLSDLPHGWQLAWTEDVSEWHIPE